MEIGFFKTASKEVNLAFEDNFGASEPTVSVKNEIFYK
jgi:hypothetical protein